MWKLIRLEWRKNNIKKYIFSTVILIALLSLFLFAQRYWGIANDPDTGIPDSAPGMDNMAVQVELFTNLSFLILTVVMLSEYIISAYKNKTQSLMFTYPIKRKKIVVSQMLAAWIFSAIALLSAKLFIYILLNAASGLEASFSLGYNIASINFYIQIVLKTILTVTIGFIPLYVGCLMKSSKAAIIFAFLLFTIMNGTVGDLSARNNAAFPIVLFVISILCAFLTVYNIEKKDVK